MREERVPQFDHCDWRAAGVLQLLNGVKASPESVGCAAADGAGKEERCIDAERHCCKTRNHETDQARHDEKMREGCIQWPIQHRDTKDLFGCYAAE